MAVYAAHLTRTLGGAPSAFQVAAQAALGGTVKPALRKLAEYLAALYPDKCGWAVEWYDELYLVFDCFLQYHYLKHYAASFSESFYGLVRVPLHVSGEFSSGARLPAGAEGASLALLVLLPYLRDRLLRATERWREKMEDGQMGKTTSDRLRMAAVRVYSIAHLVWSFYGLYQLGAYVCGKARSPTPELRLLSLALADAPPHEEDEYTWTDLLRSVFTGQIGSAMVTFPMLGALARGGVEYGAFGVQLLRWWDGRGTALGGTLPTPQPPQRDELSVRWKNKCPLCLQTWRIPTVLPVSGYVFCYPCISRHVRARGTCPVTRCPVREDQLVRMYVEE